MIMAYGSVVTFDEYSHTAIPWKRRFRYRLESLTYDEAMHDGVRDEVVVK